MFNRSSKWPSHGWVMWRGRDAGLDRVYMVAHSQNKRRFQIQKLVHRHTHTHELDNRAKSYLFYGAMARPKSKPIPGLNGLVKSCLLSLCLFLHLSLGPFLPYFKPFLGAALDNGHSFWLLMLQFHQNHTNLSQSAPSKATSGERPHCRR